LVLSGELAAVDRAADLAREAGAKAVVPLRISIASHSPLMQGAALKLAELLAVIPLREPQVPIAANITGQLLTTAEDVRRELAGQLTGPVEWTHSVAQMIESGVNTFVEIGPGQVLSRLIKRISRDVQATSLDDAKILALSARPAEG